MSVSRFWHWKCEDCKKEVQVEDYGLPKGWVFVKAKVITHRCELCKKKLERHQIGIPEVVAEK